MQVLPDEGTISKCRPTCSLEASSSSNAANAAAPSLRTWVMLGLAPMKLALLPRARLPMLVEARGGEAVDARGPLGASRLRTTSSSTSKAPNLTNVALHSGAAEVSNFSCRGLLCCPQKSGGSLLEGPQVFECNAEIVPRNTAYHFRHLAASVIHGR